MTVFETTTRLNVAAKTIAKVHKMHGIDWIDSFTMKQAEILFSQPLTKQQAEYFTEQLNKEMRRQ